MLDTDQLIVAKSTQPFHVGCTVKHRRELEDKINESCPLSQNATHHNHNIRVTLVGQPFPPPPSHDTCDVLYRDEYYRTLQFIHHYFLSYLCHPRGA
ncbi:unnamed protein product [Ectocarpus sp. 13 AM-2016]